MTEGAVQEHGEFEEAGHGNVRLYGLMLLFLAVVTLMEVGVYYLPSLHERPHLLFTVLSFLSIAKFTGVVGWYMHLKYDARYYRRVFIVPLLMALSMIVVVATLTATKYH